MLVASQQPHLSYAGTFLGAIGIYSVVPNTLAWITNNVEGVYKRGVTIGTIIAWANFNGIVSSNIYRSTDTPWYRPGNSVVLGYLSICLLGGSILNYIFLKIGNARRMNANEEHKRQKLEGLSNEEIHELADFHPDFRYTL